jgi:hypothetical protein
MSWFHFTKQERLKRHRQIRREHAETCRKEASENAFLIQRTVDDALKLAIEEERTFIDYFGEPMPPQVESALRLEIVLWRRLQEGVQRAHGIRMDEKAYDAFTESVRALLMTLINLLHAEEEMVTSCLVRHYVAIIKVIQAESARVTL